MSERELVPFAAAIASGVRTIMTSHISVPQLDQVFPATFSSIVLQGLLRDQLGFEGVIVTDALDMVGASGEIGIPEAAVRALIAGCDLLCIGTDNSDVQLDSIERALVRALDDGRLGSARLADASARVVRLAQELADEVSHIPLPEYTTEVAFPLDRSRAVFETATYEVSGLAIEPQRTIVMIETAANIAVGESPWGPAAAGASVLIVREGDVIDLAQGTQPILVGRANHRREWVRELIDDTRRRHPATIVVDMGWPGDDRRYADIATFGASRHVGLALLDFLEAKARS